MQSVTIHTQLKKTALILTSSIMLCLTVNAKSTSYSDTHSTHPQYLAFAHNTSMGGHSGISTINHRSISSWDADNKIEAQQSGVVNNKVTLKLFPCLLLLGVFLFLTRQNAGSRNINL